MIGPCGVIVRPMVRAERSNGRGPNDQCSPPLDLAEEGPAQGLLRSRSAGVPNDWFALGSFASCSLSVADVRTTTQVWF